MFVTHGIPSFFELVRKCIYNFSQRINLSSNSIIMAFWHPLYLFTHPSDNGGDQYYFNNFFFNRDIFIYLLYVCISHNYVFIVYNGQMSEMKNYYFYCYYYRYILHVLQLTISENK